MNDESTEPAVVLERTLDAPADLVWRMWTEADHFATWYGPTGASIPVSEIDLRVGGQRRVAMEINGPQGPMQMWFVGEYREIDRPRRLVYTESMADPDGRVLSPAEMGMPDDHPTTTEVIVELVDLGDKTRMVVTHVGVPADSPGAAGWNMALDKLVVHLADRSGNR